MGLSYDMEPIPSLPPEKFRLLKDSVPCVSAYGGFHCIFWYSSEELMKEAEAVCLLLGINIESRNTGGTKQKGRPFFIRILRKEIDDG